MNALIRVNRQREERASLSPGTMRCAAFLLLWLIAGAAGAAGPAGTPGGAGEEPCLACHGSPGLKKTFGSDTVALHVDGEKFAASVHAAVGCSACHADIDLKKHPAAAKKYDSARAFSVAATKVCSTCHEGVVKAYSGSVHGKASAENPGAPLCVDCHSVHAVTPATTAAHAKEACLGCHASVLEAHEKWLQNAKQHLDVVACAACHSPGAQRKVDLRLYDEGAERELAGKATAGAPSAPLDEKQLRELVQKAGPDGKVTLTGRIELSERADSHALAAKASAVRECTTCHRKGAQAFQNVTLSVIGPDGQRTRYEAKKEILAAPTSIDSLRGFYAIGGTRIGVLDLLLAAALAGGILAPLGHYVMRKLMRAKRAGKEGGHG